MKQETHTEFWYRNLLANDHLEDSNGAWGQYWNGSEGNNFMWYELCWTDSVSMLKLRSF